MEKDLSTEAKILESAREVFLRKGFDGARMQEIADAAGINKSLLHYYFRSKEKLFSAIFSGAFGEILPQINEIIASEDSLLDKIQPFVEKYTSFLLANPHLPMFILYELRRNPEAITKHIKEYGTRILGFTWQVQAEAEQGKINPVHPNHVLVNILALSVFPIIARPIFESILFDGDASRYEAFLAERPEMIAQFFRQALEPGGGKEAMS